MLGPRSQNGFFIDLEVLKGCCDTTETFIKELYSYEEEATPCMSAIPYLEDLDRILDPPPPNWLAIVFAVVAVAALLALVVFAVLACRRYVTMELSTR